MPDVDIKPKIATATLDFKENPNYGGGILEIEWVGDANWPFIGEMRRFTALYPNGMELVKKRNPLLIRLVAKAEQAWEGFVGSIGMITLAGAGFGATLFIFALLLYLLGAFAGVEVIVVTRGYY